ncbi:MAG: DUF58 domain-containing protein, partial [Bacteroidota bacterium]|nr:DUF58 domain-containing protein [Bacteroidota bacterium]
MELLRKDAISFDALSLIKKVKIIELRARKMLDNIQAGQNVSIHKGRGMSLAEVRPYTFGDDVRFIDWNVTARYHSPFVKVFQEEKEQTIMIAIDISPSTWLGIGQTSRAEYMAEIAASLAISTQRQNALLGYVLYTDHVERYHPPAKSKSVFIRMIHDVLHYEPKHKKTNTEQMLKFIQSQQKQSASIFIISDFTDQGYEYKLRQVAARHNIMGIRVTERPELAIPDLGLIAVVDIESGKRQWVDTGNPHWRNECINT